jgi:hypothetical protein
MMTLDYDTIRDMIETRWKQLCYANLLPEERDYILVWWLQAEASNGGLHQYFDSSTGDSALEAFDALKRIGAPSAAAVLSESIAMLSPGEYPTDQAKRQQALASIPDSYGAFGALTDRLFEESEDVTSLAIDRVGNTYIRQRITDAEPLVPNRMRASAILILLLIGVAVAASVAVMFFSS